MPNVDSTNISNITDKVKNDNRSDGGRVRIKSAVAAVAASPGAGTTYRLFQVNSGEKVSSIRVISTGVTAASDANVGVYESTGTSTIGADVDENIFVDAIDLSSALPGLVESVFDVTTVDKANEAIWELLGLSEDPDVTYDVVITVISASTGTGTIGAVFQIEDGS